MKKIIICADDYAQNEAISDAILELIRNQRISAVSCMTSSPEWNVYGEKLLSVSKGVDIGLHFDLTHFNSINNFSFSRLLFTSCFLNVDVDKVEYCINEQLDAFERVMKRAPDYVDGHQHIHVLPGIRYCLLKILKCRYGNAVPYLRCVNATLFSGNALIKSLVLRLLSTGFNSLAQRNGFQLTQELLGVYTLKPTRYSTLFKKWLTHSPEFGLIMCHPGYASTDYADSIKAARIVEFQYLSSDQFLQDLKEANVYVSRFSVLN